MSGTWQFSLDYVRCGLVLHTHLYLNMRRSLSIAKAVSPMECLLTDSGWQARLDGNMLAGSSFVTAELALRLHVTTPFKAQPKMTHGTSTSQHHGQGAVYRPHHVLREAAHAPGATALP